MALDLMRDITTSLKAEVLSVLGSSYKELDYVEDVAKNSFRTSNDRYGVRALGGLQEPGVTKNVTITQQYEIVLTKGYTESNLNDSPAVTKSYDNRENLLDIYKQIVNNRGGLPGTILNITDLIISEPEFLVNDKVAIQRATISVTYRYSLI